MTNWHQLRKRIHLICFLIFLALPFCNVVRFDIPHQRFYFFGFELWINEFGIIFFALMFLMFVIVVASVILGRVYCGYLCPQMIFSEASLAVQRRLRRWLKPHDRLAGAAFYAVLAIASIFLAFIFISYFVEPRDLIRRLATLDIHTAGGVSGAAVTLVTFLDFAFVRLHFCTTVCPYGYLQGMLADSNTLLVTYSDQQHDCIECKKCVRDCPMGIDIRKSPFQIECVHCGECIDSCETILGRLKTPKPGLIRYSWGVESRRRFPFDAKRIILMFVIFFYVGGLCLALSMRHAVLIRVSPDRATLYRTGSDGRIFNHFRYSIANRSHRAQAVVFSIRELPQATLILPVNPVAVKPGQTVAGEFDIAAPAGRHGEFVSHFNIVGSTLPDAVTETFPMTFICPTEAK
ncbi:MAG TPA: 4Fe-4S dicluster domain-containing protein [Verrucomicrobiae bacterium]|nr:4Fe-4S dicluster domain-containing protein [Verrucomicrobiae bacterium]